MLLQSVLCTDLSGKTPHRQVGVGKVVTSRSLGAVMVSTLAQDVRDVGLISPIFITPTTLIAVTMILNKLDAVWSLNLPYLCQCLCMSLPLCNCKHSNTYNSKGTSIAVGIDLSGKEPHRQVGVGRLVASGSLGGVMVSPLSRNARDVGLISAIGTIFFIFITPMTLLLVCYSQHIVNYTLTS